MAYTNPQQWLDLLRRRPGTRMTDLGAAGNILNASGPFLNRQGASPQRDWRSMMAEGNARRQAASSYGAPSAIQGASSSRAQQPVGRNLSTAETVAQTLGRIPGSSVSGAGVRPMTGGPSGLSPQAQQAWEQQLGLTGQTSTSPAGLQAKIGGFFNRPGAAEMLLAAGGAMSQAASQPGASFFGSLGAGTQAGVAQFNERRTQELARDRLEADTASDSAKLQQEITARQQAVRSIGAQRGLEDAKIAEYVAMAVTEEGYEYVMSQIAPELSSARSSGGVDIQNWNQYQQMLTDAGDDQDQIALAEQFWNSTQRSGSRPTGPIQIENRLKELADDGWELGMPYNDAQTALLQISENIPSVLRGQMQSPGQQRLDETMVDEMQTWNSQGRFAFATKLDKYDEILSVLDDQNNITGALVGTVMDHGWIPESFKALTVGQAINTLDTIRSIVYESLRDTLGAQFTEREGDRLVAAAYNQYLPEEMNRARMMRMRNQLVKTSENKNRMVRHWDTYGTFASYENPYKFSEDGDFLTPMAHLMIEASDYAGVDSDNLSQYIAADIDNFSAAEARALYVDLADEEETEAVLEMRRQLLARVG